MYGKLIRIKILWKLLKISVIYAIITVISVYVFFRDLRYKNLDIYSLMLFGICTVLLSIYHYFYLPAFLTNLVLLSFILGSSYIYFRIKYGKRKFVNLFFGMADLILLIFISISLPPLLFVVLILISSILTLVYALLRKSEIRLPFGSFIALTYCFIYLLFILNPQWQSILI